MKSYVDVVIPVYNGEEYLRKAIESVLSQGKVLKSLFIIDDGSTDKTKDISIDYAAINKKIKYIYQPNHGLSSARNTGIKNAKSKYIAFLDADDVWKKGKLTKQLAVFTNSRDKKLGLVYGKRDIISSFGKKIPIPKHAPIFAPSMRGSIHKHMYKRNYIVGSGSMVLVKKSCFNKSGLFNEKLQACEDWDMWLRITKNFSVDYVDDVIVSIRKHKGNMQKDRQRMLISKAAFFNSLPVEYRKIHLIKLRKILIIYLLKHPLKINVLRRINQILDDRSRYMMWGNKKEVLKDILNGANRVIYKKFISNEK